jgi:hypothetical protein
MLASAWRLAATLGVIMVTVFLAGCGHQRKPDVASIEDQTFLTPDTPMVIPLRAKHEINLYGRWYDLYDDAAQVDLFLTRQAQRYKAMFEEYGVELGQRKVRGQVVDVLPAEVFIEPAPGTKMGSISRLQRLCNDHGFYRVTIRREGAEEDQPAG